MQNPDAARESAEFIKTQLPASYGARVGLILGTGLGRWAAGLREAASIEYSEIPGFPTSTVSSHAGRFIAAHIGETPVFLLRGRFHLYEGYDPGQVAMGVRTLGELGVSTLIVTNAAGALNPQFDTGSLMAITDQINFTGQSPLTGPNHDPWGPRFPDMSRVFSPRLIEIAMTAARELGIRLERGIYIGVNGPNLETPAETRAYGRFGADAIGMSTVMETIAAAHMGMDILGVSCLTNKNLPDCMEPTSLEDVIAAADAAAGDLSRLLAAVVERL
jgi:purine-nucleoside phosphorylase